MDRSHLASLCGDVPRLATLNDYNAKFAADMSTPPQIESNRTNKRGGINLRAVAEVLDGYGLDPAEAIAKVLTEKKPLTDRNGNAVLDPKTGEPMMVPVLDTETALKAQLELLQYTRPKLKAVEVTVKEPELTPEQVEARIKALQAKAQEKS